jgi:hypothetical protein
MQLPPLNLSSGPAVSGGPTTATGATFGAFNVQRGATPWQSQLAGSLPLFLLAGALFWIYRK